MFFFFFLNLCQERLGKWLCNWKNCWWKWGSEKQKNACNKKTKGSIPLSSFWRLIYPWSQTKQCCAYFIFYKCYQERNNSIQETMSYKKDCGIKSSYIHKEYVNHRMKFLKILSLGRVICLYFLQEMKNFGSNENLLRFELSGGSLLKTLISKTKKCLFQWKHLCLQILCEYCRINSLKQIQVNVVRILKFG